MTEREEEHCVIVFSKDRPFQLFECLRSFKKFSDSHVTIYVLAKLTMSEKSRYEEVEKAFPDVRFVWEGESFENDLKGILESCKTSETIMFTVDDAFFYRDFSLSKCANLLRRRNDVYCVHLKLCPSITFCHPAQKDAKVPSLSKDDGGFLIFDRSEGTMDWNYPWDLAGSVYRTSDVNIMFRMLNSMYGSSACNHPNRLEAAGDKICKQVTTQFMLGLNKKSQCACMCEAVMSVITVNCVQDVFTNPTYSHDIDLSHLNNMLGKSHIDESKYLNQTFRSVHIGDLNLKLNKPLPLVSVLLPVYNGSKYLMEAIQSVLSQTYKNFELIVVDDGSTDSTPKLLSKIEKMDDRVQVVTCVENSGIVSALNRGLSLCQGTFVMRMDADDICVPQRLEWQVQYLMTHPSISILGGYVEIFSSSTSTSSKFKIVRHPTNPALLHFSMYLYCSIVHPSVLARTSILRTFGGYRSSYKHVEDYEMWFRMLECSSNNIRMANLPRVVLRLRKHEHNISRLRAKEQRENALKVSTNALCTRLDRRDKEDMKSCVRLLRQCTRDGIETESEAIDVMKLLMSLRDSFLQSSRYSKIELCDVAKETSKRLGYLSTLMNSKFPGSSVSQTLMLAWIQSSSRDIVHGAGKKEDNESDVVKFTATKQ